MLLESLRLGTPAYLSDGEIEKAAATLRKPAIQARAMQYYLDRAGFQGL